LPLNVKLLPSINYETFFLTINQAIEIRLNHFGFWQTELVNCSSCNYIYGNYLPESFTN